MEAVAQPIESGRLWGLTQRDCMLLAVVIAAALSVQTFFLNCTVDDAFITLRYSRNLAHGLGLVFNPGERVEGFTNFLWMLWCTLPFLAGLDAVWFSKVTLMLLAAANLILLVRFFRLVASTAPWWLPFVPASLLALNTSFTVYAVNGMETQLFCALLLFSLCIAAGEFEKGGWLSAVCFGLLFLTRPDGLLFYVATWLARLLFGRKGRDFWVWTAVFLAIVVGTTAFRLVYFGQPVPNAYYVKSAGTVGARISNWGVRYFRDIFRVLPNWGYVLLPLANVVVWNRLNKFARFTVVVPYVYLAYVLYIGGDVNLPHFRFLLHVLPLMAVAAFYPLLPRPQTGLDCAGRHTLARMGALALSLVCVVLQISHSVSTWKSMNATPESPRFRYFSLFPLAGDLSIYPHIAQHLRRTCRPGSVVVMQDVGAIPFYSEVKTFDIIGLVNAPLARYFHRMGYSDYIAGVLPLDRVIEVDTHVCNVIVDGVRAEYVLFHVDSGDPSDLSWSFHFHGLDFDPRFRLLYRPIAVYSYPGTDRCDHILFERMSEEEMLRPPS